MRTHGRSGCAKGAQQDFQPFFEGIREASITYPPDDCVEPRPDMNSCNWGQTHYDQVQNTYVTSPQLQSSDETFVQRYWRNKATGPSMSIQQDADHGGNRQAEGNHQPYLTYEAEPAYTEDANPRYPSLAEPQQIERRHEYALGHGSDAIRNTNNSMSSIREFVRPESAPWSTYDPRQPWYGIGVGGTRDNIEFAQHGSTSSSLQGNQFSMEFDQSFMMADRNMHEAGPSVVQCVPPDLRIQGCINTSPTVGLPPSIPGGGGSGLTGMDNASVPPSFGDHSLSSRLSAPSYIPSSTASNTHSCSECGSQYTGRYGEGNLRRHHRLKHKSGVVSLRCEYENCGKKFLRSDARLKHYRNGHGIPL